jgi:hypothetical protein
LSLIKFVVSEKYYSLSQKGNIKTLSTAELSFNISLVGKGGGHDRDRMVVGFTTTCAISAYHH